VGSGAILVVGWMSPQARIVGSASVGFVTVVGLRVRGLGSVRSVERSSMWCRIVE
jgi:hypothetical protein